MTLLLHACCAQCLLDVWDAARKATGDCAPGDVLVFFENPNIHPYGEFAKREKSARLVAERLGARFESTGYGLAEFLRAVYNEPGLGDPAAHGESGDRARCRVCYRMRLGAAAARAAENGACFASTLQSSPMQDHAAVLEVGREAGARAGVRFVDADWRALHGTGEAPKGLRVHRQQYCGCVFSEFERFGPERSRGERECPTK